MQYSIKSIEIIDIIKLNLIARPMPESVRMRPIYLYLIQSVTGRIEDLEG